MRAVEVLPLVPVMWMAGYWSWGEPSSSISASMRESGAGAIRRGVRPDGTPASASKRSAWCIEPGPGFAELHRDAVYAGSGAGSGSASSTSTLSSSPGSMSRSPVTRPASRRSSTARSSACDRCGRDVHRGADDLGAHRSLHVALRLADLARARRRRRCTRSCPRPGPRALRPWATAARCTEPSCHHDHTSSVTNGRCGANSRSSVDSATVSAVRADRAPSSPSEP